MMVQASKRDLSDLEGRVAFMQHSFFDPQPITNAAAYLLRQITHNWNDKDCVRIFQGFASAMEKNPSAPLLINDIVLPALRSSSLFQERRLRQIDIMMMVALGAKQRSAAQFKTLLEQADPRFTVSDPVYLQIKCSYFFLNLKWQTN
jgi:hypothetical protein